MFPESQDKAPSTLRFYSELSQCLTAVNFERQVSALCEPIYWEEYLEERIGIDPVVYFKMLMIGFLENLSSERAIAARCEDSLSLRAFLGYGPEEPTPDHRNLGVIRQRLGPQICQDVLKVVLLALKSHELLDGEKIDPDVIEGNANLRSLINRNTEHVCRNYFKELTGQPGVVPQSAQLVRLFDERRYQEPKICAVTKEIPFHESSEDAHQARWCRSLWRHADNTSQKGSQAR